MKFHIIFPGHVEQLPGFICLFLLVIQITNQQFNSMNGLLEIFDFLGFTNSVTFFALQKTDDLPLSVSINCCQKKKNEKDVVRYSQEKKINNGKIWVIVQYLYIRISALFFFLFTSEIENQKGTPKKRAPIIDLYRTNFQFEKDRWKAGRQRKKKPKLCRISPLYGILSSNTA